MLFTNIDLLVLIYWNGILTRKADYRYIKRYGGNDGYEKEDDILKNHKIIGNALNENLKDSRLLPEDKDKLIGEGIAGELGDLHALDDLKDRHVLTEGDIMKIRENVHHHDKPAIKIREPKIRHHRARHRPYAGRPHHRMRAGLKHRPGTHRAVRPGEMMAGAPGSKKNLRPGEAAAGKNEPRVLKSLDPNRPKKGRGGMFSDLEAADEDIIMPTPEMKKEIDDLEEVANNMVLGDDGSNNPELQELAKDLAMYPQLNQDTVEKLKRFKELLKEKEKPYFNDRRALQSVDSPDVPDDIKQAVVGQNYAEGANSDAYGPESKAGPIPGPFTTPRERAAQQAQAEQEARAANPFGFPDSPDPRTPAYQRAQKAKEKEMEKAFQQGVYDNAIKSNKSPREAKNRALVAGKYAQERNYLKGQNFSDRQADQIAANDARDFQNEVERLNPSHPRPKTLKYSDLKQQLQDEEEQERRASQERRREAEQAREAKIAQMIQAANRASENLMQEQAKTAEEQAAQEKMQQEIEEAANRAIEDVRSLGGSEAEMRQAAQEARMVKIGQNQIKRRAIAEQTQRLLLQQISSLSEAQNLAGHISQAHSADEILANSANELRQMSIQKLSERDEEDEEYEEVSVVRAIPDNAERINLKNAIVDLPLKKLPDILAKNDSEQRQKDWLLVLRDMYRNKITAVKIFNGQSSVKLPDGFLSIPANSESLYVERGRVYYTPHAYAEMEKEGLDVSALRHQLPDKDNSLGEETDFYVADLEGVNIGVPTSLNPNPSMLAHNSKESIDISKASKLIILLGYIDLIPWNLYSAFLRPKEGDKKDFQVDPVAHSRKDPNDQKIRIFADDTAEITPRNGITEIVPVSQVLYVMGRHDTPRRYAPIFEFNMENLDRLGRPLADVAGRPVMAEEPRTRPQKRVGDTDGIRVFNLLVDNVDNRLSQSTGLPSDDLRDGLDNMTNEGMDGMVVFYKLVSDPNNTHLMSEATKQPFATELKQNFPDIDNLVLYKIISNYIEDVTGLPNHVNGRVLTHFPLSLISTNPRAPQMVVQGLYPSNGAPGYGPGSLQPGRTFYNNPYNKMNNVPPVKTHKKPFYSYGLKDPNDVMNGPSNYPKDGGNYDPKVLTNIVTDGGPLKFTVPGNMAPNATPPPPAPGRYYGGNPGNIRTTNAPVVGPIGGGAAPGGGAGPGAPGGGAAPGGGGAPGRGGPRTSRGIPRRRRGWFR